MKNIKTFKFIVLIVSVLFIVIVGGLIYISYNDYSEENIEEAINNYLIDRYDKVSSQNFEQSIENQTKYYSKRLLSNPAWVNSEDNIESGRKFFEETGFTTAIMSTAIDKMNRKEYKVKLSVLYANEHFVNDNFINYEYIFKVNKQGFHKYVFDNIELISNKITYIDGGEIHVHGGEAAVINVDEATVHNVDDHSDCDSH